MIARRARMDYFPRMTFVRWAWCCAAGIALGLGLCGCLPGGDSRADEEKEPHFLMGRKLVGQRDYTGAIDAYEDALQVNPQSASAHFELAWLYEGKADDPAAAIYHYQRFLKLAPHSGNAEVAQAHINTCKLELAKSASSIAPISAAAQRDLDKLLQENKDLKARLAPLQAFYDSHNFAASNPPAQPVSGNQTAPLPPINPVRNGSQSVNAPSSNAVAANRSPAPSTVKTHTIKSGETLAAIARKYGVSLASLEAVNPQASPTHLQVGSTLNVPAP